MANLPRKVEERIRDSIRRYAPILIAQRDRDVSEADTVTVVKDLLSDVFGYDKYAEVTSEHAIRGTYCDLAIKIEGKLRLLIEVKAIGLALAEKHIKQAVDYAANQGLDWVVLTNGIRWLLFRIAFKKPIEANLIVEFDLLAADPKAAADIQKLYLLTKEGLVRGAVVEFSERQSATSKYLLAALLVNDGDVLNAIRRELRRVTDILVPAETIAEVLKSEVLKREALEGDAAISAARQITRLDRERCAPVIGEVPTIQNLPATLSAPTTPPAPVAAPGTT